MDIHNEGHEAFKGLSFYDVNKRILYKKIFNDKLKDKNIEWFLRDRIGASQKWTSKSDQSAIYTDPLS